MLNPFIRSTVLAALASASATAAEWTWTWTQPAASAAPQAVICPLRYGKHWAYAVELDDGPAWIRTLAVPFLAGFSYTDAPPELAGKGAQRPFVGGAAVIVGAVGSNSSVLDWNAIRELRTQGWGILNHSYAHSGKWWVEAERLDDAQVRTDAFWSQAIFASELGTAPTAAVYANGYVDYDRDGALAKRGVLLATRVGGSSSRNLLGPGVTWMDFPRNYLDEGAWTAGGKGEVMSGFPAGDATPPRGEFIIDFTHGIDADLASANRRRWTRRLTTIAGQWGAAGDDSLWCAPSDEIATYARVAAKASTSVSGTTLTVRLPADLPGSALIVRLDGVAENAVLQAPAGGTLHRDRGTVWLTTPLIGTAGAPAPSPRVKRIYQGPATDVTFATPVAVAAVRVGLQGRPAPGSRELITLRTATGDRVLVDAPLTGQWISTTRLHSLVPNTPAVTATAVVIAPDPLQTSMEVWALE